MLPLFLPLLFLSRMKWMGNNKVYILLWCFYLNKFSFHVFSTSPAHNALHLYRYERASWHGWWHLLVWSEMWQLCGWYWDTVPGLFLHFSSFGFISTTFSPRSFFCVDFLCLLYSSALLEAFEHKKAFLWVCITPRLSFEKMKRLYTSEELLCVVSGC